MKQVLSNVKVSEVPSLITRLGFDPNQMVNLTIESAEEDVLAVMDRIGQKAHENGLTEEILAELLMDKH
ncbi:hypothetical protein [Picosynechococcus sp. PCC 73109]|uniref:hypothetical protein n=1 Tax=Picosynechococcus sp. PCC 73109 TaxID=374982 RepID=UPI000745939D|nr:hypothetical protein [Picosynechococcus sp. PCC 73109]AMA10657.1 hypothetical protein AWQ23_14510 [Picosynechococcus sp. PCC 73109]